MSTSPVAAASATPASKPAPPKISTDEAVPRRGARWQSYITPLLVVILALAVLITITRNWNAWEGGKVDQATDDAYVAGDVTPELEDDDYRAQVDQANAAVAASRAGIEGNLRQRQLQDARIAKALAG